MAFAALPNVHLWWSEDRETGPSPPTPGVRVAFLVKSAEDEALVDRDRVDLVFRDAAHRAVSPEPRPAEVDQLCSCMRA